MLEKIEILELLGRICSDGQSIVSKKGRKNGAFRKKMSADATKRKIARGVRFYLIKTRKTIDMTCCFRAFMLLLFFRPHFTQRHLWKFVKSIRTGGSVEKQNQQTKGVINRNRRTREEESSKRLSGKNDGCARR